MKFFLMLSAAFLSVTGIFGQHNDFRTANWGASMEDIRAVETSSFVMNVGLSALVYKDEMAGEPCEAYYLFNENDRLSSGVYSFIKEHANVQQYVTSYDKFLEMLVVKYGEPDGEKQTWHHGFREVERESFGREIAEGNLSLSTQWARPGGSVCITLSRGLGMQPELKIQYSSKPVLMAVNKSQGKKKMSIAKF